MGCKVKIPIFSVFTNMEFMPKNKVGRKIPPKDLVQLSSSLFGGVGGGGGREGFQTRKPLKGHPDADQNSSTLCM